MRMVVPADLEVRAGALVGAPFRAKGDTPEGWDCRGCARWCLSEFCGIALPDYRDLYDAAIVSPGGASERARLIGEGLEAWRPVAAQAGAVVFLSWLGRAGHIGFMLGRRRFLHADTRCGTAIEDLSNPACPYRAKGFFAPAFVTEIVHP